MKKNEQKLIAKFYEFKVKQLMSKKWREIYEKTSN